MIASSNSLCRERSAHSLRRGSSSRHVRCRAVSRTNRTLTTANTHNHSATSNTSEPRCVVPSRPWLCSCADLGTRLRWRKGGVAALVRARARGCKGPKLQLALFASHVREPSRNGRSGHSHRARTSRPQDYRHDREIFASRSEAHARSCRAAGRSYGDSDRHHYRHQASNAISGARRSIAVSL